MCGIAGIVGIHPDSRAVMTAMLHALRHRGPDGEGAIHGPEAVLGHRRLSIIDLEGGRQPLTNADESLWLVCNGEIYNHRELRARLEAGGYRFRTHSDCEVILGLYERYGDDLLAHLRGMFAFALWDTRRRRLLAARDHLGQKPFFYAVDDGRLLFASEIKALLVAQPRLRAMNLAALDEYFALRLIAPPLTMFQGVQKLPPGHKLVAEAGSEPCVSPYWDLRYQPKRHDSDDVLVDELESHLEESLRLHLVSDVPVGAYLSGGLDSSLLVAMLARRLGVKNLPTFTIGLPYAAYDESPAARRVALQFGTDHHERTLQPTLAETLPDLVECMDEPTDALSLCSFQAAAFAREHVKVVIGGDGGDELFGGYDRYYGNQYANRYACVPAWLRRGLIGPLLRHLPKTRWYKSRANQALWLHELSFSAGGERYAASLTFFHFPHRARQELFTSAALRALDGHDAEGVIRQPYERGDGSALDKMMYADSLIRLPDHPVVISDRTSMAHGLETRSPYMDHRLAEFAAQLPEHLKVRGRGLRVIQRRLASRYLPPDVLARPKQGFASALPYLLGAQFQRLSPRVLAGSRLVEEGILRRDTIDRLLQADRDRSADHGVRLWLLVNAELWYRMKILGVTRDAMRQELTEVFAS